MSGQPSLWLLLLLAFLTDLALRGHVRAGVPAPDLPHLVLLWAACVGGRKLAYPAALVLWVGRLVGGLSTPLEAGLPLLGGLEMVIFSGRFVQLRDRGRRWWAVLLGLLVGQVIQGLLDGPLPASLRQGMAALPLVALSTIILLPILDAVRPLLPALRSG